MISDIDPMILGGRGGTTSLTQLEGRLYFPGMGDNGMELYAYDPQTDRTFEVADINPAGDSNPGCDQKLEAAREQRRQRRQQQVA